MTVLAGKRGTWINQFAQPSVAVFKARAVEVDYVIIKYGLAIYEKLAHQAGVQWLAERMGESGPGSQDGPQRAAQYAQELANQANQPGCIGAVINLEEADGGWHTDDGTGTQRLIYDFRAKAPGKPLFASLDTRGNRPNYPYQRVCAALCDGVMPMVYPGAFQQPAAVAFAAALNALMRERWQGKEIIPTFQTYGDVDVGPQVTQLVGHATAGVIVGANSYTLGHATDAQWASSLAFKPPTSTPPPPDPNVIAALAAIRKLWLDGTHQIEQKGTVQELVAWAGFWKGLTGA